MRPNTYYKHPKNTSICMEVLKSFYIKEKDTYSLRVAWWKWSPKRGICYPLNIEERINMSVMKAREWELLDD